MTENELNQTQERVRMFKVLKKEYEETEKLAQVLATASIPDCRMIIVSNYLLGVDSFTLRFKDELFNDFLNLLDRHSAALKAEMEAI